MAEPDFPTLNPYANIAGSLSPYRIDPSVLKEESEYILPFGSDGKRGHSEKLLWATGSSYLSGLCVGSTWGIVEGIHRSGEMTAKLRANSVLNGIGRRGPLVANNIGVAVLLYRLIDSSIIKARGSTDDAYNQIGSGALAGIAFRSTAGPRAILVGGTLGLAIAATSFVISNRFMS
ncbi:uncharacterized protein LOC135815160 [Sycon ciliatum]|uniref:uncharacterized protein LOC135815160 n=1 Tax=Sycon ciliatum TaxID=27933 RepID=UPI0031F652F3